MGGGSYSGEKYAKSSYAAAAATGTSFSHTRAVHSGAVKAEVHELLDPKTKAGKTSPLAGKIVREARDNADHPNSVPVIVAFDETGSMGEIPVLFQKKLAELFTLVGLKGYLPDMQLCVGAYGDMDNREKAPLQISQFEADNRADAALDVIYIEQNGGGNGHESAAAVWLYAARHTACDAFEKRGKKGYVFTIGDETTGGITKANWQNYVDADTTMQADMTAVDVAKACQEQWELYHIIIDNGAAKGQGSLKHYSHLLGKNNVLVIENGGENAVCEVIALAIGMAEGTIDLDAGLLDLDEAGVDADSKRIAGKTLARFSGGGSVAVAVADAPADLDTTDGAARL